MIDVDISGLENDAKDVIVSFIESKLPVKGERDGDKLSFEDRSDRNHVTNPEIRTYLKRFLHKNKLRQSYRLLSESGTLSFVKRKEEEVEKEEKESKK